MQVTEKTTKTSTRKARSKQKIEERLFLEYQDQIDVTNLMETAKNEFKKLYPDDSIYIIFPPFFIYEDKMASFSYK